MKIQVFESVEWYHVFIMREGEDIEIISVNILKNDGILVTYKYKNEIF